MGKILLFDDSKEFRGTRISIRRNKYLLVDDTHVRYVGQGLFHQKTEYRKDDKRAEVSKG